MKDFGDNLRKVRKRRKLTQVEAAKLAGIGQSLWSEYETGVRNPTLEQAERLAKAVNSTLKRLI